MNKCPRCNSTDLTTVNYNPYTDTFNYRCNCCKFSGTFRYNEYVKYINTYTTNTSIPNNRTR